jgi:ABC-type polysaccharide/polyol phosphate export permease
MEAERPMKTRTSPPPPHTEFFPPARTPLLPLGWLHAIAKDMRELGRFRAVVQNLVTQDLRLRYHRSVLGFCWSLLNPILMMAVLTVVFASLLGRGNDWRDFAIYLFSGQVPWLFLVGAVLESAFCIIQNENLIRKIYVPKLIFPVSRVLFNLVNFVLSLGALFLLLVPLGATVSWALLMLPVAIGLFAAFVLGLAVLVAVLNTFYRDLSHLVGVFLQAWYFATPIIYEASQFKTSPWFLTLNPAYAFIRQFHMIIRDHRCPDAATLVVAACLAAASLGIGYAAYKAHEDRLIFRL